MENQAGKSARFVATVARLLAALLPAELLDQHAELVNFLNFLRRLSDFQYLDDCVDLRGLKGKLPGGILGGCYQKRKQL